MAHARFCLEYRAECEIQRMKSAVGLTRARWAELVKVNAEVNRTIAPRANDGGMAAERWLVAPRAGDCHDYAVTKRHELLARGWPSRALLLAEVVTGWGEHHLVLVVRTSDGDFVADNLNANIRPWYATRYQWVRMQSPQNPKFWSTVADASDAPQGPVGFNAYSGGAKSDILVEADETEVAMAASEPTAPTERAEIASPGAAQAQDGLIQNDGVADAAVAWAAPAVAASAQFDDLVDETLRGLAAAARVAAAEAPAPAQPAQITAALAQFADAVVEAWTRETTADLDGRSVPIQPPEGVVDSSLEITAGFSQTQIDGLL
jgi:predicted transglutaminase-like cysteine proteinase